MNRLSIGPTATRQPKTRQPLWRRLLRLKPPTFTCYAPPPGQSLDRYSLRECHRVMERGGTCIIYPYENGTPARVTEPEYT